MARFWNYFEKFAAFIAGVFTDENGRPSFARIGAGMALSFACGWITDIVRHTHALPDFGGVALFVGTLYGLNVVKNGVMKGGING
jgi:hypothetical protein